MRARPGELPHGTTPGFQLCRFLGGRNKGQNKTQSDELAGQVRLDRQASTRVGLLIALEGSEG